MAAFDDCLKVVLQSEGGFANNPHDPGGTTMLGVTKAVWEAWTGKPASEADMRALTPALVAPLYRSRYWDVNRCGDMAKPIALCVFDFGVNAGNSRAAQFLQRAVGAPKDGTIGPTTLAALTSAVASRGVAAIVNDYMQDRRTYYRANHLFSLFGKGWLARCDAVEAAAKKMGAN